MNKIRLLLVAAMMLPFFDQAETQAVEVADIFGPEMILQRDIPVPIWGSAQPGEIVTVEFAGQNKTATADSAGRWSVDLQAMQASDALRTLTVKGDGESVAIENVRVGEVWLVLSHGIDKQFSCEGPVPRPDARIRPFGDSRNIDSPTPQVKTGDNRQWGPSRHASFDLLTIPFVNRISDATGVPVGIVRVEVGGLDATIPVEGFAAISELKDIAQRVETWYPTNPRGKAAYMQWYAAMQHWRAVIEKKMATGESIRPAQPPLVPGPELGDPAQPTVVYNRQIHPLVPFAFRGAIHLQEESSQGDPSCTTDLRYTAKMRALVAGLRAVFRRPDMPVAFSQRGTPSIYHGHTVGGKENRENISELNFNAWHGHRDRQRRVLSTDGVGIIVTADVENYEGAIGERFARWALAEAYGRDGASSGPIYKSHRVEGDQVIIQFDHADGGLMTAHYPKIGQPLVEQPAGRVRFFAVAGEDRIFHRAYGKVKGDTVVLSSPKVARPIAVRYACHFDPRGMNLYNRAGLPASPFCSDDWPMANFDTTVEQYKEKSIDELVARLGYPTMLHSHAAAKALATKDEATLLPLIKRLLMDTHHDLRCGGVRTLGYLYWYGLVPRSYYGQEPQAITPEISTALNWIAHMATRERDMHVLRCSAEAFGLIGAEDDHIASVVKLLAVDSDPLVRTAALRLCKYRFKTYEHNHSLAHAVLAEHPHGDRTSLALAGTIINHARLNGPTDIEAIASYLEKVGPGQGGPVMPSLGDTLRRVYLPDGKRKALDDPRVMSGLLHLYSIGYRNYFLYGIWRWVTVEDHRPAIEAEIVRLEKEIERLEREKPENWQDLSGRYSAAVEGLREVLSK